MDEASQPKSPLSKKDNDQNLLADDLEPISPEDFDDGSDELQQPENEQQNDETDTNKTTTAPAENENDKQSEMEVDEVSQEIENVNNIDGDVSMENQDEEGEKSEEHKDDGSKENKDDEAEENKDDEGEENKDDEGEKTKDGESEKTEDGESVENKVVESEEKKDDEGEENKDDEGGEKSADKIDEDVEKDKDQTETEKSENKDKEHSDDKDEDHEEHNDDKEHDKTPGTAENTENADGSMDASTSGNHEPEEVNMESLPEAAKDKSMAEDPFDMLMSSRETHNEGDDKSRPVSNVDETDEHDDAETDGGGDKEKSATTSTAVSPSRDDNQDTTAEAVVDDIEEGKGVDEELSLLPDAEREISDADKQRALLAEEAHTTDVPEVIDIDDDDDDTTSNQTLQNNTEKSTNDVANDENDAAEVNQLNESVEISAAAPKEGEIKEIQSDFPEQTCIECNTVRLCKYTLLQEGTEKYLCEIDCVSTYRQKSTETFTLTVKKVIITLIADTEQKCTRCSEEKKPCRYRLKTAEKTFDYICDDTCLQKFIGKNTEKFVVRKKRYLIEEISETADPKKCIHCLQMVTCRFYFKQDDEELYVCKDDCLNLLVVEQSDRFRIKRRSVRVRDLPKRAGSGSATISTEPIVEKEPEKPLARTPAEATAARIDRETSFTRRCAQCYTVVIPNDKSLMWETLDFCNEICLGQYQNVIGSACTTCQNTVNLTSLGKYCVRFGYEIRQFCRAACLDEYKKGLKVCSFCQKDISKNAEGFLASISGQFKDFCSQNCLKKYDEMCNPKKKTTAGICSVCNNVDQVRVEILIDGREHPFCSNPCFSAFKFVNNITPDKCSMCTKYFERKTDNAHTIYSEKNVTMFCSKICLNFYIITNRKIVPCQWCKVKKYNFDMIEKYTGPSAIMLCSLNCLTLCEVSMNAISMKKQKCDQCSSISTPQYHLTMSDASLRNFCTYQCVMSFQSQFSHAPLSFDGETPASNSPVPTGLPKRIKNTVPASAVAQTAALQAKTGRLATITKLPVGRPKGSLASANTKVPVISNVTSLAPPNTRRGGKGSMQPVVELEPLSPYLLKKTYAPASSKRATAGTRGRAATPPPVTPPPPIVETKTQIITLPALPKVVGNKSTMCKPMMESKEISCRPTLCTVGNQTDSILERKILIPVPVPIYVPQPMHMYSMPIPIPIPIPLPIPVPVFVPTTRNSASGIMKEIKKIQDKMPTDPFEAELLMMAEMVAGDKKKSESDSETDDDVPVNDYATETITENNAFGEDMLQMALKMAGEYEEPAVDLESAMTANTITPSNHPHMPSEDVDDPGAMHHHHMLLMEHQRQIQTGRGRKRGSAAMQPRNNRVTPPAKRNRRQEMPIISPPPEPAREPVEKADANMCLKFTFGVNAWKQWVMTKNADLEKSSIKRKPFKSELLQLTADELNYSLCLFVKEVRKPNGSEYAPDTIYYLVLGIQQYLYENGRIDNIFTDPYYERFTDCLDDVAKKFSVLYNDSQYIVTRVEEEHLWECKQLGAHSPHVLLSTLMFFNTKHFNLTTVEEHMQLSFSHIMKHWKRNPNQVGAAKLPGSRNVLLRFYPPQSALDSNSRKKKVYEQQENEENPLRCPVKLYEFYLSKCPESVKTRNDVFYLQPERSCVPDSPVWYSTQALGKDSLCKMLHRVKMVKEINIALLTS